MRTGRTVCMWWSTLTGPSWWSFERKCGSRESRSMASAHASVWMSDIILSTLR